MNDKVGKAFHVIEALLPAPTLPALKGGVGRAHYSPVKALPYSSGVSGGSPLRQ